jgi:uncharacterized protein (DUF433 family)
LPITVSEIMDYLAEDMETEQIIAKHPELTNADIVACVAFFISKHGFPKMS